MKSNDKGKEENEVRMELKYCVPLVEELPIAMKKARKATLPVGRRPVVDDYDYGVDGEGPKDLEAAGGVA